jgi:hypothetical protein
MTDIEPRSAQEVAAEHAYNVECRIKATVRQMRQAWSELARDLYEFYSASLWRDLGHDSFEEWMAGPDIEVQRRWAYELISIYRELVVLREVRMSDLAEIEPSKLQEVLPAVRRDQVTVAEAMADAKSLSKNDIRERYRPGGAGTTPSANGSKPDVSTRYEALHEPAYVRCPTCGSRVREEEMSGHADA